MIHRRLDRPEPEKLPSLPLPVYIHGVGRNVFKPGFQELLEPDNFVEICWMESGVCDWELHGGRVQLKAGETIFKLPYELRRKYVSPTEGAVHYWVAFDGPAAEWLMKSYGYEQKPMKGGDCPVHLFEEIEKGLLSMSVFSQRNMLGALLEIIARMAGSDNEDNSKGGIVVRRFFHLVQECYGDCEVNINAIADELGVSRITLNRMIQKKAGCTPIDYLTRFRLQQGRMLLAESNLSVNAIARRIGIRRSNYFCRLIRENTGMTPLEYRRKNISASCVNGST